MKRELPVLSFAPFRKYPTRQEQQQYDDSREVCQNCVSGGCCSSEDPVYLTSFDVFRFAAFFDMSPAEFMLNFNYKDKIVKKYRYAHLADFIRLVKLFECGGVYADIDTIFVNKLPDRLFQQNFVIGKENDVPCAKTGGIPSCFTAPRPLLWRGSIVTSRLRTTRPPAGR